MRVLEPGRPGDQESSIVAAFVERYAAEPAAVGRAPGRVNLIGEHTDYNAGLCLPVALRHATLAAVGVRDDKMVRVASAQQGEDWTGTLDTVGPADVEGWASYVTGVLWSLAEQGIAVPGVDILVDSNVPVGAGLSSSAALECAVAVAVLEASGTRLSDSVRRDVVAACIRAETEVVGAPTGGMDQTVAMWARAGHALLIDFASDEHRQVPLDLGGHTLLVTDTRVSHELTDGGYAARRADCEAAAAALGVGSLREADLEAVGRLADGRLRRRARHVVTEIARVLDCVSALEGRDWAEVGQLFAASHASMRDDFEISCAELDLTVDTAMAAGAIAARMTGGGFGGSTVSVVDQESVEPVMRAVEGAFERAHLRPPAYLRVLPSDGASVVRPSLPHQRPRRRRG